MPAFQNTPAIPSMAPPKPAQAAAPTLGGAMGSPAMPAMPATTPAAAAQGLATAQGAIAGQTPVNLAAGAVDSNPAAMARAAGAMPGAGTPGSFGQSVAAAAQARNAARRAGRVPGQMGEGEMDPTDVRGFAPVGENQAFGPGYMRALEQRSKQMPAEMQPPVLPAQAAANPEYMDAWGGY